MIFNNDKFLLFSRRECFFICTVETVAGNFLARDITDQYYVLKETNLGFVQLLSTRVFSIDNEFNILNERSVISYFPIEVFSLSKIARLSP